MDTALMLETMIYIRVARVNRRRRAQVRAPGSPGEDMYTQCLLATSKGTCMRCTVCVGTLPNLGYLRHLRHLRQKTVKPVFSVQVSARRLTVLTMLDHCGAQVAGARCNCTCLRHSLAPRARAPC